MLKLRKAYTGFLALMGVLIVLWGLFLIPTYESPVTLVLLLAVAIGATTTTTILVGGRINVSVGSAISFAAVGLFDPVAGAMVATLSEVGIWLINVYSGQRIWRSELERLGANAGMQAVSILIGGVAYTLFVNWLGADTILG